MVTAAPSGVASRSTDDVESRTPCGAASDRMGCSGGFAATIQGDRWRDIEVFPPWTEDPFSIDMKRKYEHAGAPLSGAYCVDMLPENERDFRRKYDRYIQVRVCTLLRHLMSEMSWQTLWPDGFVHLETLITVESGHRRQTNPQPLIDLFRRSYMTTPTR